MADLDDNAGDKQRSNDFRRAQESHDLLVESVRDYAIFMLDPDGHVATWNAGAERIKGYRADEIIGQHFSTLLSARGRRRAAGPSTSWSVAARGGPLRGRGLARAQGRHAASGPTSSSPRCATATGELRGFAKVTRDLTERRAPRKSAAPERGALPAAGRERPGLRDLHARPRRPRRELERRAPSASRATRPRRSSASTSRVSIRRRTCAAARPDDELAGARRDGRFEDEGWRVRKDGTRFWANVVITALRDADGDAARLRQGHARPDRARAGVRDAGGGRAGA